MTDALTACVKHSRESDERDREKGGLHVIFCGLLSSWLDIFDQHANCTNVVNSLCYQTGEYLKKEELLLLLVHDQKIKKSKYVKWLYV